jgi:hypothetical protein
MASSASEYAFLTRADISDSELKARMLAGIRALATERSFYAQRPPHPIYRAVVSAHGSDTVEKSASEGVLDVGVIFTFQQNTHGLPSCECDHGSTADLTNSDIRVKLYHIISQIVFEHPDISLESVQEYQRHAFRWLYMNQLALTDRREYEKRFGDFEAKTFVDVVNAHHKVTRNYSMTPGSLTGENYQLEYSDRTRQRVWLLPGISVARELIDIGSGRLGIECHRITTEYGVFVDGASPAPGVTLNIFDIAQQLYTNPASKQHEPDYETCRRVKAVKDRYDSDLAELNTRQMFGLISKYIIGAAVKGKKTQQQERLEEDFALARSNNALMDGLMACIDRGVGIVSPPTKLVQVFFSKFNSNFDEWLKGKMRVDAIDTLISAIEQLNTRDILSDAGPNHAIFLQFGIPQHARDIVIFIRKVFILSEFRRLPFYKAALPSLDITSNQIISLLRLHSIVNRGTSTPVIFIMDQVCRICNSQSKCKDSHSDLGFDEVTTPNGTQKGRFSGGMRSKKYRYNRYNNHNHTRIKKISSRSCRKMYNLKRFKRTRQRH